VTVPPGDGRAIEALARYCLRTPVSLTRTGPANPPLPLTPAHSRRGRKSKFLSSGIEDVEDILADLDQALGGSKGAGGAAETHELADSR